MKVTGAREPLKKAHRGGRHVLGNLEEGMSIFDILEMFRDGHGIDAEASGDPFQQIIMAAAHAEGDNDNEDVINEEREEHNDRGERMIQPLTGDSDHSDEDMELLNSINRSSNMNPSQGSRRHNNNEMIGRLSNPNRVRGNENHIIEHS
jgi:hypothetical protein